MNLAEFRKQYPQYDDMPDADLVRSLHGKFYQDMPFQEFSKQVGYTAEEEEAPRGGMAMPKEPSTARYYAEKAGAGIEGLMDRLVQEPKVELPTTAWTPETDPLASLMPAERPLEVPQDLTAAHLPTPGLVPAHGAKTTNALQDIANTAGDVASGIISWTGGGLSALLAAAEGKPLEEISKTATNAIKFLKGPPAKDEYGREIEPGPIGKAVAWPFEKIGEAGENLTQWVFEQTGSPFLGAMLGTAPELAAAALPFLGRLRRGPGKGIVPKESPEFAEGLSEGQRLRALAKEDPAAFKQAFDEALAKRMPAEAEKPPVSAEKPAEVAKPTESIPPPEKPAVAPAEAPTAVKLEEKPYAPSLRRDQTLDAEVQPGVVGGRVEGAREQGLQRDQEAGGARPAPREEAPKEEGISEADKPINPAFMLSSGEIVTGQAHGDIAAKDPRVFQKGTQEGFERGGKFYLLEELRKPIGAQKPIEGPKEGEKAEVVADKTTTLRGRIKKMGGIRPGNMKGELKDTELGKQRLLKNSGEPLDLAEQTLRDEGWLRPDENLVDVLRDKENLRRGKVAGEGVEKPESQMTAQEKRVKAETEWEAEEPPKGDYVTLDADDLPKGKKLTLIEGKTSRGWDVYEVVEKDPFGITLRDGSEIELKPGDKVEVRREDIEAGKPALQLQGERQMPKAQAEMRIRGKKMAGAEQGGLEFGAPPPLKELLLKAETVGAKEAQRVREMMAAEAKAATEKQAQAGEFTLREAPGVAPSTAAKGKPPGRFKFSDDVESRYQAAMGVRRPGVASRVSSTLQSMAMKMSREFEHMPNTGEFAEAGFAIRRLAKQKEVAAYQAIKDLEGVTLKLNNQDFDLFSRKVVMDDLSEVAKEEKALPFGFTPETMKAEIARLDTHVADNSAVKDALKRRQAVWDVIKADYIQAQKDIGFNVENRLKRESYFRHQVLEYVNAKGIFGSGKKLKTPTGRGFLKKRQGSELDINTNYLEAEHEVMSQMLYDIEVAKTIKRIDDKYNIKGKLKKDAKGNLIIPEGYVEWQPREGNVFFMSDTIPAKMAEDLLSGKLKELGVTEEDIGRALTMGGKRRSFVIKEELAATLDNLVRQRSTNPIMQADRAITLSWKAWQLVSPRRYVKYNFRNWTGDLDAAFAGDPSILKKIPRATADLYKAYTTQTMPPDLRDFFDRGGMQSTLQFQEMGDINGLKMFMRFSKERGKITDLPFKVWRGYWTAARMSTDFREAIIRYSAYLTAMERMKSSPDGLPKSYWASRPEEVKGLADIKDRSFMMSNDLIGAYDRISVMGQALREHVFPFWSWKEVNPKRYWRLMANASNDGKLASTVGRKALGSAVIRTPYRAYVIGKWLIRATALWSLLQVWNHTRHPEEEEQLPPDVRHRPHIIFGRDEETGEILYFSRLGAVGDLLEWFGLDAAPQHIDRLMKGESPMEIAKEMAKSPVNILVGGSLPLVKLAGEYMTRQALFPDVFNPRAIRDRGLHLARSFGLENEYKELAELPRKPYTESVGSAFYYRIDPLESSYSQAYSLKQKWLKKQGKIGEGFWITPQGQALYNMKLALRYGDKESMQKYFLEYLYQVAPQIKPDKNFDKEIEKRMETSFKWMAPLSGMDQNEQLAFFTSLNKSEQKTLLRANEFYARMFDPAHNDMRMLKGK